MIRHYFVLIITLLPFVWIGCSDDGNCVFNPLLNDRNLIINSSFECNYTPTLTGWMFRDTSIAHFSNDAPPNGGRYSIVLKSIWFSPYSHNAIFTKVILPQGTYRYQLSCWAKKTGFVGGSISLFYGNGQIDTLTAQRKLIVTDTTWTLYSTKDTITSTSGDAVLIGIHGGGHELLSGTSWFDLCKFERLD